MDLKDLPLLQGAMRVWDMGPMLLFLIVQTIFTNRILKLSVIDTSISTQIFACAVSLPFIYITAKNLQNRPALHKAPDPRPSYLTIGFKKIFKTFADMWKDFPEAAKFLIAMAFFESASLSLIQVSGEDRSGCAALAVRGVDNGLQRVFSFIDDRCARDSCSMN